MRHRSGNIAAVLFVAVVFSLPAALTGPATAAGSGGSQTSADAGGGTSADAGGGTSAEAGGGTSGEAGSPAPRASLPQLEGEVMCPTCGTLLELSRAPAAERERAFIRKLIAEGRSEDEIKDALVAEYGPGALALPDEDGINFWAYVLPLLVFATALAAVILSVVSWRRNRDATG